MRSNCRVWSLRTLLFGAVATFVSAVTPAQTVPSAYKTGYWYNIGGQLTGEVRPYADGGYLATRYVYNAAGLLAEKEDGSLSAWPTDSDPSQAPWSGFSISTIETYTYDSMGRMISKELSAGNGVPYSLTQYSYDTVERVQCVAVRMNPSQYTSLPSACTLGTQGVYGQDRITYTLYDAQDHPTTIYRGYGSQVQEVYAAYKYTPNGLAQYVTDADLNRMMLAYDGLDRLADWYFPSATSTGTVDTSDYEAYIYDANNNRTNLKKRDGEYISYQYDDLNRVTLKHVPSASQDVYYGYDLRGLMTGAYFGSASGAGITNAYDGFGEMTSTKSTMGAVSLAVTQDFDADGDRTSVGYPDGSYFAYDYDGLDRLSDVRENGGATVVNESYNAYGLLSGETRGGVTSIYGYDAVERPQTWTDDFANSAQDVTITLGYNPESQIISREHDNDDYDYLDYVNGSTTYSPNGLNQYASVGTNNFTYDLNGNLKSDGSTTFTYDVENRLTLASGAHNATLTYDPLGRLFQVTGSITTQFLYAGDQLVAEYNGSGAIQRHYVQGPGTDEPLLWYEGTAVSSTTRRSLQVDYQNSVQSVADAAGHVLGINRYDEYGTPSTSNMGRFQYTGQAYIPELGLYYYRARMYNPTLGRFMQTDPIGYQDNLDLYAYVGNDPLDRTDPSGKCDVDGEHHWGWCLWHTLGFYQTKGDRVQTARNFFKNNTVLENGVAVDPQKLSDQQVLQAFKDFTDSWRQIASTGADPAAVMAAAPFMTSWGWNNSQPYVKARNELNTPGDHETLNGKVPTRAEANQMIEEAGGTVQRNDPGHASGGVSTHTEPHVNYTTASGQKATVSVREN